METNKDNQDLSLFAQRLLHLESRLDRQERAMHALRGIVVSLERMHQGLSVENPGPPPELTPYTTNTNTDTKAPK